MNFIKNLIFATGSLMLLAASAVAEEIVLVKLKGAEIITKADLDAYVARRIDLRHLSRSMWGVETILKEMAMARIMTIEGEQLGEPRLGNANEKFDDKYALRIHQKLSQRCDPPKDESAARRFYAENPKAFEVPPQAKLSRVIFPVTSVVDEKNVNAWLMEQVQNIGAGKISFNDLVDQALRINGVDIQGDLGWVALSQENAILRAISSARPGDYVGPVVEGRYVYLFHVIDRRDLKILPWEVVVNQINQRSIAYCRQQNNEIIRNEMFKKYSVEFDVGKIRSLFESVAR